MSDLAAMDGVSVHRGSVGRWLHRLGLNQKRTLLASEILQPDITERRKVWLETRQPELANMLERLVFNDETSLKSNLVKTTGWAPVGERLIDHTSFRHRHTPYWALPVVR